jgi:excinuclease ABC subunit A
LSDFIVVKGAREHNLRNVDVEIPRGRLVVFTGLSGSGKSSLAFDTIYAEGQRRYVQSLSAYARQFIDQMEKPDVDSIEGLSPAISIEQRTTTRNPRSTVGTATEVYDYLRLLYSTIGKPHCCRCGREISSQTAEQIAARVLDLGTKARVEILAPVVRGRKGEYRRELADMRSKGFVRARIDGRMVDLDGDHKLAKSVHHDIDVVVDRLVLRAGIEKRLAASLDVAFKLGGDNVTILSRPVGRDEEWDESTFSRRFACGECGISYPEISPRLFSFNSPMGACPDCSGVGKTTVFDRNRLVVDPGRAVTSGAVGPWGKRLAEKYKRQVVRVCHELGVAPDTPYAELPERARTALMEGFESKAQTGGRGRRFAGIVPILMKRYRESESDFVREDLAKYMVDTSCPGCAGARLREEARHILVDGRAIHHAAAMPVADAFQWLQTLKLARREKQIAKLVLREITERMKFMVDVGLGYLCIDRPMGTLSGGESQRVRLATQIGAGLSGVLYVLDEPSIGLHPRDNARLLGSLRRLTESGNSVLVVEHDMDTIRSADYVVDLGPGAGKDGGHLVAQGEPTVVGEAAGSLTGGFLSGRETIPVPRARRAGRSERITVRGARVNNLQEVTADFPLGAFVCVTGVSGSGKSSLVIDTLYPALAVARNGAQCEVGACDGIDGLEQVDKVIEIDQAPIGRTPRSNPATYTGLFSDIRDLFAMLPEAQVRGFGPGRFSFNVEGGRCETCRGDGLIRVEMHFLPDLYVVCDACSGRRYNEETLQIRYKGKNIADVLDMTVGEALEFLSNIPAAERRLETLVSVGLDYVHLGQSATTLSGGEAQRIKLAKELARRSTGSTVYILDEPTTGLHSADVRRLLDVLGRLVDAGNTVIVIEHHLDVIKSADHVIDLGPEGGGEGGRIVAQGTPETVAGVKASHTGRFLASVLGEAGADAPCRESP